MAERVGHKKVIFTPIKPHQRTYVCLLCTQKFDNDSERTIHEREFHARKRGKKALYDFGPGTLRQNFLSCKFCWQKFVNPKALTEHLYSSDHLAEEIFIGKFTQIFNNPKNIKLVKSGLDINGEKTGDNGVNENSGPELVNGELKIGGVNSGKNEEIKIHNLKLHDGDIELPKTPPNNDSMNDASSFSPPDSKKRRVAIKSMTGKNSPKNSPKKPSQTGASSLNSPDVQEIPVSSNSLHNCPYCTKKCADKGMLQLHIKRQHAQKLERQTFYCVVDKSKHHSYDELNAYYIMEHLEKNAKKCALMMQSCRICDMKCQTEYEARQHEFEVHEHLFDEAKLDIDFEVSCIFCTFKCNSMLEMYGHEIKCHKTLLPLLRYSKDIISLITAFNCVYCREHFRNEGILYKHQAECKLKSQ